VTFEERLEKLAERHEVLTQGVELHEREMAEIRREGALMRADLRRAFAMGVREARNERRRRRELDEKMDEKIGQLASAQLITEEKLQALYGRMDSFIDSMRRGGNGNPRGQ